MEKKKKKEKNHPRLIEEVRYKRPTLAIERVVVLQDELPEEP
jgi:hypothetical protein